MTVGHARGYWTVPAAGSSLRAPGSQPLLTEGEFLDMLCTSVVEAELFRGG